MNHFKHILLLLIFLAYGCSEKTDWRTNLARLLSTSTTTEQELLIEKIVKASPDWREITARISEMNFPGVETGRVYLNWMTCLDEISRPWVIYVPSSYSPTVPTPLLVVLHGGVTKPTIMEEPEKHAREHYFTELAEKHGWLVLFPSARAGATWWNSIGMNLVHWQIRLAKIRYNVDDDFVWMAGFSDGASASFGQAMMLPGDYAAFVALNGHIGMTGMAGGWQTYPANIYNTPVYAVTNDGDRLFPTEKMKPMIDLALKAGADITYREHEGGHDLSYGDEELPLIAEFLEGHPRDRFAERLTWETSDRKFGQCRWFTIDAITSGKSASWHVDYNLELVDSAVAPGFMPGRHAGPGIKIANVDAGESFARSVGLQIGDMVTHIDNMPVNSMDDLRNALSAIRAGTEARVSVKRRRMEMTLAGTMPPPKKHHLFARQKPSAAVKVSASANRIDIEASRVGAFRILIHPDMFDISSPITISVNGKTVFDKVVSPDSEFILRNFLSNRDRKLLYVNEISIEL